MLLPDDTDRVDSEATRTSQALVSTDRSERYGKQLVGHLGRHHGGDWSEDDRRGWIQFADGRADLACVPGGLRLSVEARAEDLARLEDVFSRHLIRFGAKDELQVNWSQA